MHAHRNSAWVCVHARVAEVNAGPVLGVLSMACAENSWTGLMFAAVLKFKMPFSR